MNILKLFFLTFFIFASLFLVSVQSRLHNHTKHTHIHHPIKTHISTPPSPSSPPSTSSSPSPNNVFDVRSFGAIGDGLADETLAFKSTWDTVCGFRSQPSSTLLVPRGYTFMIQSTIFTGPCKNIVVFQVDGTIIAPDGPEAWLESNGKLQWLVFYRLNGFKFQGGGLIDGRGEKWWDLPCKPHKGINGTTLSGPCDSPTALRFFMSSNLTVKELKIENSPKFNFRFDNCRDVHVESLKIRAPSNSPNTDGIHVENTQNVGIYNTLISNGDDCVSIGSGSYNVDIKNVTCGPSHGISIGSLGYHNSRSCVSNITVRDSVIKYSDNGVRIKTWQGGSGSVSQVTFENVHMDTVRNPILIDQYYCLSSACMNQTSAVFVSDITYTNIKGTYDSRTPPMRFGCSDSVPCTNLTLSDIELLPAQGYILEDPFCWNAYGASQTLTIPPLSCLMEGVPRSIEENDFDLC